MAITADAQTLPADFSQVLVANTITKPTTMVFAPDGRLFVAEQTGALRVIKNGALLSKPFITLDVNASGERGLLGIAFDPAFASNHYIYLYHTLPSAANNRISRFTATGDTAALSSEVVVLDLDPLSTATNHNGGTMQFGKDGKLYIGVGENANPPNAQNLDTYMGKILRINPDGSAPADNPFPSGSAQRQRVWAYGMRNPFTLAIQPGTGRVFVDDVGQDTWEEINDCTTGGGNYGWPTAEGMSSNSSFVNPIYTYHHGSGSGLGCAITGGTFFNPATTSYPSQYTGNYFFLDYCGKWIDQLTLNGSSATRSTFASGLPGSLVCMATGPDGNLYFLSRANEAVYKIVYTTSSAPLITEQPQPQTAAQGTSVSFSVTATGAAPLSYQWRKNGTAISGAISDTYTLASVKASDSGTYSVVVHNTSGSKTSNGAKLTVTASNTAPQAAITTPTSGATYAGGQVINFSGTGTDAEDGTLPASAFQWYVVFHHDAHTHPGPTAPSGVKSGSFVIPNSGETSSNVFYRLYLVVTDAQGATDTAYTDIKPRTSTITLNTTPQGLQLTLDGQPFKTPLTVTSVEGVVRSIGAPSPQMINNALIDTFGKWSNGGAQTQSFATPLNDTVFTALFKTVLRPADHPATTVAGLHYDYYQGAWRNLPDFALLTPLSSGSVANISLNPRARDDSFGFRFTGYISVPKSGIYGFFTTSDDGSKLYIDTAVVVQNDGVHSNHEASGRIGLQAGRHKISIVYFERTGLQSLSVQYSGPGVTKQLVPDTAWSHDGTASQQRAIENNGAEKSLNRSALMLEVYPNPAQNRVTLAMTHFSGNGRVKVFDASGRLVKEQVVTQAQLQLFTGDLRNGLYLITIEDKNGRATKKLRIQN